MVLDIGSGDVIWLMDLLSCPKPSLHFSSKASGILQLKPQFGPPSPQPRFSYNIQIMTLSSEDKANAIWSEALRVLQLVQVGLRLCHLSVSSQIGDQARPRHTETVTPFHSGLFSGSEHLLALAGISLKSWAINSPVFFLNTLFLPLLGSFCATHDE